jgi:hypothetical protein
MTTSTARRPHVDDVSHQRVLEDVFVQQPADALIRIVWLSELWDQVVEEITGELQEAYFEARLQGRMDAALKLAPHGRKTFLAMTRHENNARGQMVRWGDGQKA